MLFYNPTDAGYVEVVYPTPGVFRDGTIGWRAMANDGTTLYRFDTSQSSLMDLFQCYVALANKCMLPFTATEDASRMAVDSNAMRVSHSMRR